MEIEKLKEMKTMMVERGNWKEVTKINKMIEMHKK